VWRIKDLKPFISGETEPLLQLKNGRVANSGSGVGLQNLFNTCSIQVATSIKK
jgi:hypothetical protein